MAGKKQKPPWMKKPYSKRLKGFKLKGPDIISESIGRKLKELAFAEARVKHGLKTYMFERKLPRGCLWCRHYARDTYRDFPDDGIYWWEECGECCHPEVRKQLYRCKIRLNVYTQFGPPDHWLPCWPILFDPWLVYQCDGYDEMTREEWAPLRDAMAAEKDARRDFLLRAQDERRVRRLQKEAERRARKDGQNNDPVRRGDEPGEPDDNPCWLPEESGPDGDDVDLGLQHERGSESAGHEPGVDLEVDQAREASEPARHRKSRGAPRVPRRMAVGAKRSARKPRREEQRIERLELEGFGPNQEGGASCLDPSGPADRRRTSPGSKFRR